MDKEGNVGDVVKPCSNMFVIWNNLQSLPMTNLFHGADC